MGYTRSDTLMVDLADMGENPAESPYNCHIEIDKEERQAVIVWTESLQFHAEYNADEWSEYAEDGWLKADVQERLVARLRGLLESQGHVQAVVYSVEYGGDEPNVTFEVVTGYQDGETYEHWLDRIGWPVVATLINVTDPGTFNSAYLFDMREVAQ